MTVDLSTSTAKAVMPVRTPPPACLFLTSVLAYALTIFSRLRVTLEVALRVSIVTADIATTRS
jgi:hypothetical protein